VNGSAPRAEVITLGCRLNIAESERIHALVAGEDVIVVNSCAVTSEAVRQTRQAIRRARRKRPDARLLVTGCAADIEREQLAAMDEVDGIIANEAKLDARSWNVAEPLAPPRPQQHTRAFIGVQTGCDHACTFCIIPQGRGKSRSLSVAQVLREVESHLEQGAPEAVLTGVDLTSWGHDLPSAPGLGALVAAILDAFPQLVRLRLSSVDGVEIDGQLFELLVSEKRLAPYLHLSLQHGADLILKRMKRRHDRADAFTLVERLKARRPEIAIGADIIAGFPTETPAHHADNLSLIRDLAIVHGHIFPYSPRPGTPAARMPQVDRVLIKERAAELREAVCAVRADWLDSLVGTRLSVLAEADGAGYAGNFARVRVPQGTPRGSLIAITPQSVTGGLLQ